MLLQHFIPRVCNHSSNTLLYEVPFKSESLSLHLVKMAQKVCISELTNFSGGHSLADCRRVAQESLELAVVEAEKLPCIMEEAEALTGALAKYKHWRSTTEGLLKGHLHGKVVLHAGMLHGDEVHRSQDGSVKLDASSSLQSLPQDPALNHARSTKELQRDQGTESEGSPFVARQQDAQLDDPLLLGHVGARSLAIEASRPGSELPQRVEQGELAELENDGRSVGEQAISPASKAEQATQEFPDLRSYSPENGSASPGLENDFQRDGQQEARAGGDAKERFASVRPHLTLRTLNQLLKSTLSIEIDVGGLQESLLKAVRLHRWRKKASAALQANTHYTGAPSLGNA